MTDSACACGTTNTLQNEIDTIIITVSHLQNLTYFQQMMLSERMQDTNEWDALFTLHSVFCNQLEALQKSCGTLSDAFSFPKPKRFVPEIRQHASRSSAATQPKTPLPE